MRQARVSFVDALGMSEYTEKPWQLVRSEQGPALILFQTRFDQVANPRTGRSLKAIVLEAPDWVNVVAVTPEGKVVVVHQYRFGTGQTTIEIPAGIVEKGETPQQAAIRELKEETGYTTTRWKYLGWVESNPAFLNNHCHQWLAQAVVKTQAAEPDANEDIAVSEFSLAEVRQAIADERIRNSLALLALSHVFDLRGDSEREQFSGEK